MVESSNTFELNYREYSDKLANINLETIQNELGIVRDGDRLFISFFNNKFYISNSGIVDESGNRPDYITYVILAKYLLLCPERLCFNKEWVSFKEFKKVSHFTNVNYFNSDTEGAIERHFSGRVNDLRKACGRLNGSHHKIETSYELSIQFNALPRISLLLLFNDSDEEFPAKCTVLFQKSAEYYLDPESLAMTSACLAKKLKQLVFS